MFLDWAYQDGHQEVQRFLLQKQPLQDMNKDSLKILASAILKQQVKYANIETLPRIKHLSSVLMEISLDAKFFSDLLVLVPLHLAIKENLDDSIIMAILETSSNLALVSYLDSLPFFAAIEYSKKYKVDTLMALLNAHKEAANIYDKDGRCALEIALIYKSPEKLILAILNASSGKQKVKIANRLLFAAIKNKYSAEVISSISKGRTGTLLIPRNGKIMIQVIWSNLVFLMNALLIFVLYPLPEMDILCKAIISRKYDAVQRLPKQSKKCAQIFWTYLVLSMLEAAVANQHNMSLQEPVQASNSTSRHKILELTKMIQDEMEVLERRFEPEIEPIKAIKEKVKEEVSDCDTSDEWTMLDQN